MRSYNIKRDLKVKYSAEVAHGQQHDTSFTVVSDRDTTGTAPLALDVVVADEVMLLMVIAPNQYHSASSGNTNIKNCAQDEPASCESLVSFVFY